MNQISNQKMRYMLMWPGIGLILWGIFYLNDILARIPTNGLNLFILAMGCACLWAWVTPLIRKLAGRWPLDDALRWRTLALHLMASLIFSLLMSCVMALVFMATSFWLMGRTVPFARIFPGTVYYFALVKVVFYWAVVAADSALHYLIRFRREAAQAEALQKQLAEAQLRVLRAQLQPHFLFNTLHSLAALIRTGERNAALEVLVDLGDLLRMALKADRHAWVPLREERFLAEKYLSIERQRFGDRASFEIDIDPALEDEPIPPLLLQPLVENAVRHGLEADPDADWLRLAVRDQDASLCISVEDNGPGFPDQWLLAEHCGTGLGHTQARLEGLYSEKVVVEVGKSPRGGAKVIVRLPKRKGADRGT